MRARNDSDLVLIANRIERHNERIYELVRDIQNGRHPNADAIVQALDEDEIPNKSSALSIVLDHLIRPDYWRDRC